jgi:ribonuclease VapC
MVIDSSALTAILLGEAEAMSFARVILAEPVRLMSAANALETEIVAMRKLGQDIGTVVRVLVDSLAIAIVPVTADQYRIAAEAYRSYGKGFHPAALN